MTKDCSDGGGAVDCGWESDCRSVGVVTVELAEVEVGSTGEADLDCRIGEDDTSRTETWRL